MIAIGRQRLLIGSSSGNPGWWKYVLAAVVGLGVIGWAGHGSQVSATELYKGLPWIGDFLSRMLPPNWEFMAKLVKPAIETIQIAMWGTLLAILLAVPVCLGLRRDMPAAKYS